MSKPPPPSTTPIDWSVDKTNAIAERLEELVVEQGLGRNELARMFGVSASTVSLAAKRAGVSFATRPPAEAVAALRRRVTTRRYALAEQLAVTAVRVLEAIDPGDAAAARQLAIAGAVLVDKAILLDAQVQADIERAEAEHDRAEAAEEQRVHAELMRNARQLVEQSGGVDAAREKLRLEALAEGIDLDALDDDEL
ncbi:hypothetical protein [Nocardia sp. NPDC004711]